MKNNEDEQDKLQRMASLLRDGAAMLQQQCPVCSSPLFKLRSGEIICPMCQKPVVMIKDDSEIVGIYLKRILTDLAGTIGEKIQKLNEEIRNENNEGELMEKTRLLLLLLDSIERINRMNKDHPE